MISSRFFTLFPPPALLSMRPVGIDISDQSIKYCRLVLKSGGFRSDLLGERSLEAGVIATGQIINKPKLIQALAELRKDLNCSHVYASLPEEKAYIIKLHLPDMRQSELRQSIELQLEEHVPLPATGVVFDYEVIRAPEKEGEGYDLVVSVLPKDVVADYLDAFSQAGIATLGFEVEAQAVVRSLLVPKHRQTSLVIDFGKTRTGFFVTEGSRVMLTSTVDQVGGDLITRAIQKNLGVTSAEAEQLKITRGLLQSGDNKLYFSLLPIVSVLRDEINNFYGYWNKRSAETHAANTKIEKILLCGGQATLPGLVEYLNASFDIPVALGDVWKNVLDVTKTVPPLTLNQSLRYATAIGLALRPFDFIS